MTHVEQTVAELRERLTDQKATFLLVYSVENHLTQAYDTRISSNSSQAGIRAILAAIMRPTNKAVEILSAEIEATARASLGMDPLRIEQAHEQGAFHAAAKILFEKLSPWFTIAGWTDVETKPSTFSS